MTTREKAQWVVGKVKGFVAEVGNMGSSVLNGVLMSHDVLHLVAKHGMHGQTIILDLFDLQRSDRVRVVIERLSLNLRGSMASLGCSESKPSPVKLAYLAH